MVVVVTCEGEQHDQGKEEGTDGGTMPTQCFLLNIENEKTPFFNTRKKNKKHGKKNKNTVMILLCMVQNKYVPFRSDQKSTANPYKN